MNADIPHPQSSRIAWREQLLPHRLQQNAQHAHGPDALGLRHAASKLVVAEQYPGADANGQRQGLVIGPAHGRGESSRPPHGVKTEIVFKCDNFWTDQYTISIPAVLRRGSFNTGNTRPNNVLSK